MLERRQYFFGKQKYETRSVLCTQMYRFDIGALTTGTATPINLPAGSVLHSFLVYVDEAVEGSSSTVQFGITGGNQLTAAIAEASLTAGTWHGVADGAPTPITSDDTFDIIVGTADLTAGMVTIFLNIIVPPDVDAIDDVDQLVL